MFKNKNQTVLEAIADSIADPQTLLHLRFSICAPKPGQTAKISRNPLSDKPKRTQMSPNESKRAQTSPNEPKRTQTNPNEPKQTASLILDLIHFSDLRPVAPNCARVALFCARVARPKLVEICRNAMFLMLKLVKTGNPLLKLEIQHG